jgi:hypothetical protein
VWDVFKDWPHKDFAMPKVSEVYGGTYLSGGDLAGQTHRLSIQSVAVEEVGDDREEKLVVAFNGAKKSLVLNKTNASALVSAFGDDTESWIGRNVELFTVPVNFNGRTYDGVRVRSVVEAQTSTLMASEAAVKPFGVPATQTKAAMKHAHAIGDGAPF